MKRKSSRGRKEAKYTEEDTVELENGSKDSGEEDDAAPVEKPKRSRKGDKANKADEGEEEENGTVEEEEDPLKVPDKKSKGKKAAESPAKRGRKNDKAKKADDGDEEENGTVEDEEDPLKIPDKKSKGKKAAAPPAELSESEEEDDEPLKIPDKKSKGKKAAAPPAESSESEEEDDEPEYEVDDILDEKNIKGSKYYLIRWKGFGEESDTWEPVSTLNCPDVVARYKNNKKNAKAPKKEKAAKTKAKSKTKSHRTADDGDEEETTEEYEVSKILEVHFRRDGKREFLVCWKGYPQEESTWEPEENMDCSDLIENFMKKVEKARNANERELRVKPPATDRLTLRMYEGKNSRRLSKRNSGAQRVHYYDAE